MKKNIHEKDVENLIQLMGKCVHKWENIPTLPDVWRCSICGADGHERSYLDFTSTDKAWISFGRLVDWAKDSKHPNNFIKDTIMESLARSHGSISGSPSALRIEFIDPVIFARLILNELDDYIKYKKREEKISFRKQFREEEKI